MNPRYIFDFAFRIFIVILPFITVVSIFTREKLGIPGFAFLKELLLFFMFLSVIWCHVRWIQKLKITKLDILIVLYIFTLIIISSFTTRFSGILYGWRYDFSFLLAFLVVWHGRNFLHHSTSYYIRIFLISWGIMLFLSMLLKWPLSEDYLLYLWYSGNPSNWQFGSSIPIFHGVDGANVRRFQWLLDGPNTMGAFLLMYIGILVYFFRNHKNWHFVIGGIVSILLVCIIYTYSRSAFLWFLSGVWLVILFLLPKIFKYYRTQFFAIILIWMLWIWWIFIQYAGNSKAILWRGWSTNWHLERMQIWLMRFISAPFWQWLWSAGPAYRYVQKLENTDRSQIEEIDKRYIPESWYIQQLIEWGILWFILFMSIMMMILYKLYQKHVLLMWMFVSILTMNFFLHTFESAVVSLSIFSLIALILAPHEKSGS